MTGGDGGKPAACINRVGGRKQIVEMAPNAYQSLARRWVRRASARGMHRTPCNRQYAHLCRRVARQSKIQQKELTQMADLQIAWLDIPVNNWWILAMQIGEDVERLIRPTSTSWRAAVPVAAAPEWQDPLQGCNNHQELAGSLHRITVPWAGKDDEAPPTTALPFKGSPQRAIATQICFTATVWPNR